ncbi:MAG TPA: heme-degrading domain-containing protein [Acidobacteriaceae bacterium]|nr:heme-degrading domain-containing protein [Acidobacteriaceae bacterium]
MGALEDLAVIARQEELLRWEGFDADVAWRLGGVMREMLVERGAGGTVEIEVAGQVLFTAATVGATPGQADWIRRKRNTVRRFARSSYAVGRQLERDGDTMEARHGLMLADYAAHGGGFPVWVRGVGVVGSAIVSGMPQRDDHNLVVAAMAQVLGVEAPVLE